DRPVLVSACDPLNLVGIVTPGPRVPAQPGNHVIFRDGVPLASVQGTSLSLIASDEQEVVQEFQTRRLPQLKLSPVTKPPVTS
ncbi:MAG: hypothetical protein O2854_09280, partial [Chloroflexi bacterium]|nr:hypothetical protein [Chloroflexota bacterium]